jgi:hypothetical protein
MTAPRPLIDRPLIAVSLLVLATLSACNRDRAEEATPATPAPGTAAVITPAEAAAPMAFESKTLYAEVSLTLPIALRSQPDLHARLYAANVRDLRAFAEGAQADRTEAGGDEGLPPYDKTIEITPGAETAKLFSLMRTASEFTGGAHPNAQFSAILWDKALKREIAAADLFTKPADMTALDQALCAAINAEKRRRDPAAQTVSLTGAGDWKCPRAAETPFVLAASTEPGKAGGLTFLVGPYVVGPYAEGTYEINVPVTAFRALIAPAYAGEFGGALKVG